jgi:hypothetical protein
VALERREEVVALGPDLARARVDLAALIAADAAALERKKGVVEGGTRLEPGGTEVGQDRHG